jgi:catechol 2,3-dioxygenase-like lactoylglutathione lyase family enzyme
LTSLLIDTGTEREPKMNSRWQLAVTIAVLSLGAAMAGQAPGGRSGTAAAAAAVKLPLDNLGVEHLDIVVPDTAASAQFYARIFRTRLHQQPVRDTLRYFVVLGDVPADRQVGYIAIGAAQDRPPAIGHYCVLARTYNAAGFGAALQAAGLPATPTAAGPIGMWPDPDGLELQLFQPPAGLVTAAVPSPLPVEGEGIVNPLGVDHIMLNVSSMEKALPYYRGIYGTAAERPPDANGRVWFQMERNTRIGLQVAPGRMAAIDHFAIKVARYERAALVTRLNQLGAKLLPAADEPDVVRFLDNNGITVEVRAQ